MLIRRYSETDAEATLTVFVRAIDRTARAHYSDAQRTAWAHRAGRTVPGWHADRSAADTWVAEIDGRVVGFIDLDEAGTIDMLFVDPDFGRRGIAATLLMKPLALAAERRLAQVRTYASDTARPFFLAHGFHVEAERTVVVRGVEMPQTVLVFTRDGDAG